ncbi:leucine--tRNA ligase, mitochondrial isoform X1 [Octopus bimaculoides]|nr:leucine--tRNA ligase, mitochondrial isoform X1 [Octopus bimaculoides]|eukprot:XP_014773131.1 PREDICTED: probable leucine--tRNA ligase, mitochondrial isoform X1 [Octopus bimaculoides]
MHPFTLYYNDMIYIIEVTNMIVGRRWMNPDLFRKWFCWKPWSKYRSLFSKTGIWENTFKAEKRKEIEEYWKPKIQELDKIGVTDPNADKYYVLSMFPYPSGRLHMGHVRVYTISDAMARYKRLLGKKTIHPMGWDAFGLPAENAAIDKGQHPAKWTYSNIKSMKKQIEDLCCSFDWDREIFTCNPAYYKWTQYIFLKMYEAGLVYHKQALVNWDPVDQTVLADEQINDLGCSWRSGAKVEKRSLRQWYLKTTAYAKSLWDGLATVDQNLWRDIISLQKNWIGKCNGCHFYFTIMDGATRLPDAVAVYTKQPAAIYGVSHIVLAPSHHLNVPNYHTPGADHTAGNKDQDVLLTLKAIHPFTKAEIPVIVSPTTEFDMFNECSLGIPCLSVEDAKMAQEFGLQTVEVFATNGDEEVLINSGQFTGFRKSEAMKSIPEYAKQNNVGGHLVSSHLKDWLISRQRYWGTPIPLIHCEKCKVVPVPYQDLPVELATVKELSGKCIAPLSHLKDWQKVQCPQCGGPAKRETDTMDTFVDSSWYFLRYLDPCNDSTMCDPAVAGKEMPVDLYIGGKEHATLHLYYARFVSHFLYDLGVLAQKEPFINLLTQGMVMGRSYKVRDTGSYLSQDQVDFSGDHPVEAATGLAVDTFWEKMSKSKRNGVDPEDVLNEFGVDSTRICILSNVAPKSHRNWSNEEFRGIINWQSKIWKLVSDFILVKTSGSFQEVSPQLMKQHEEKIFEFRNYFLKEVTFHFEKTFLISVAISRLQGFTNSMRKIPADVRANSEAFGSVLADFVIMLGPLAPSFASELWAGLGSVAPQTSSYDWSQSVLHQKWPRIDEKYQLPLIVRHQGVEIFSKRLSKNQLNQLTDLTAYEYIATSEKVRNRMKGLKLSDLHFCLDEDYRAEFTIPH